jgi:hypothetical protein
MSSSLSLLSLLLLASDESFALLLLLLPPALLLGLRFDAGGRLPLVGGGGRWCCPWWWFAAPAAAAGALGFACAARAARGMSSSLLELMAGAPRAQRRRIRRDSCNCVLMLRVPRAAVGVCLHRRVWHRKSNQARLMRM